MFVLWRIEQENYSNTFFCIFDIDFCGALQLFQGFLSLAKACAHSVCDFLLTTSEARVDY